MDLRIVTRRVLNSYEKIKSIERTLNSKKEMRNYMIFETHAHYDDQAFEQDRESLLKELKEQNIGTVVNIGASIASSQKTLELTKQYPFFYGAIGVHPDETKELTEENFLQLKEVAQQEKVVAIGEIGLDYYWDSTPREVQKYWFEKQLDLAVELQLPVVIHSRESASDTLEIIKKYVQKTNGTLTGVIHCFSYGVELAEEYVKMGFYLGIGGVVTFKNGRKLKEVVQKIPLEYLVLETDSPYLAPVPYRGKRNTSLNLCYIAEEVANIKQISVEEVIKTTTENANTLYQIERRGLWQH